eukprot:scaffold131_cov174-Ochromonas_danica.AAC.8
MINNNQTIQALVRKKDEEEAKPKNSVAPLQQRVVVLIPHLEGSVPYSLLYAAVQYSVRHPLSSLSTPTTETKIKDYSKERKMTALEIQHLKRKGRKIAMITAYDYPTVSDSLALSLVPSSPSLSLC